MIDFKPGDIVHHIVGLPGPDLDKATIVAKRDDGNYDIKFQVYGQGEWFNEVGFPNGNRIGGIFK
jgi:hypothetical protein